MKFENVSSQKSGSSIVIDFQMINIHTGTYVIGAKRKRTMDLILLSACWLSLDAPIVTIHADWYVGSTQESET